MEINKILPTCLVHSDYSEGVPAEQIRARWIYKKVYYICGIVNLNDLQKKEKTG